MSRRHFRTVMPICESNACGHWVSAEDLLDNPSLPGKVGCDLSPVCRCRIVGHLMRGGGCLDADNPQFGNASSTADQTVETDRLQ